MGGFAANACPDVFNIIQLSIDGSDLRLAYRKTSIGEGDESTQGASTAGRGQPTATPPSLHRS